MNDSIKRNVILVIVLFILTITCLDYFYRKNENSKMTIKVVGKVYDFHMDAGLHEYYMFKYFYNYRIYNEYELIEDEFDKNLIGKCFEVKLNPKNPKKSKLILTKESNCKLYDASRKNPDGALYE